MQQMLSWIVCQTGTAGARPAPKSSRTWAKSTNPTLNNDLRLPPAPKGQGLRPEASPPAFPLPALPPALSAGAASSAAPATSAAAAAAAVTAAGLVPAGEAAAALLPRGLRGSPGGRSSESLAASTSSANAALALAVVNAEALLLSLLPNSSARSAAITAAESCGVPLAER